MKFIYLSFPCFFFLLSSSTLAQITSDGTLQNPTRVERQGDIIEITEGTTREKNLFHSFEEFSVPNGTEAFFNNEAGITNIFSKVTGNNPSVIDGLIRANGTVDLYLLNPNGIILGESSSLNIGGSLFAIAGESIAFEDGVIFSTQDTQAQPLLTVSVPVGIEFAENPAPVVDNSLIPLSPFIQLYDREFNITERNKDSFNVFFDEPSLITSDGTLDNPTTVEQKGSFLEITEGTTRGKNLFHSFEYFSIPKGAEVVFNNELGITNIFSRVTGDTFSVIEGFIRLNNPANLYLLNPNGIVFDATASLDTGILLYAISGESILFEDRVEFSTKDTIEQPLLTASLPTNFIFPENPIPILNFSLINFSLNRDLLLPTDLADENRDHIFIFENISSETSSITSDETLDNPTTVEQQGVSIEITGGTTRGENLFHSFENFSVPNGIIAFFNNQEGITNIFGRVTGNQVSNIDGFIRLNNPANLYLLNPNGIVFGTSASLDTDVLLYAISGESIVFEDRVEFSTKDTIEQPLLTASLPTNFIFPENPVPVEDSSLIQIPLEGDEEFFLPPNIAFENLDNVLVFLGDEVFSSIYFDGIDEISASTIDIDEDANIVIENITKNSEKLSINAINTEDNLTSSCVKSTQSGSSFIITGSGGLKHQPQNAANAYFSTGAIQTFDSSKITTPNENKQWKIGDPIVEPTGVYRLPSGQLIISHQCRELINEEK